MKKRHGILLPILLVLAAVLAFGACSEDSESSSQDSSASELIFSSAESFEEALNEGIDCSEAKVTFTAIDYLPDSSLGINCTAGEHLNFILENESDISAGDTVTGLVTGKPEKTLFGSWKIPFEVQNVEQLQPSEENVSESSIADKTEEVESDTVSEVEEMPPSEASEANEEPQSEASEAEEKSFSEESEVSEAETSESVESSSQIDEPKLTAEDLNVSVLTEANHIDHDRYTLGNGEGVTITVSASAVGVEADDIVLLYDDTMLNVEAKDPYISDGATCFEYYVTGIAEGTSQLGIVTYDDYSAEAENAYGYILDFYKLDSTNGKITYITPTGEKHHYSKECAGENAIKTTYYDATNSGYEACAKCGN